MHAAWPAPMAPAVERLLAFIAGDGATDAAFDAVARELFTLQYDHDEAYRRFCQRRGCTPRRVAGWRDIPAVHYMIAAFGGPTVRCGDYAPFGTPELSRLALAGLEGRSGVLLANHGAIVIGADLRRALWRAIELEDLARLFYLSLIAGGAVILDDDEIMRTVARFDHYGPRDDG